MYEAFIAANKAEFKHKIRNEFLTSNIDTELKSLFDECGGCSFRNGLYKVHDLNSSMHWAILISNYFPKYKSKIIPFGHDWLGRQFARDTSRKDLLLMFDPATSEDFELELDIVSFHNQELVYERNSTVSEDIFNNVLQLLSLSEISYNDCIGPKVPLSLGGDDVIENYEVWDLEVYWEMLCQIYLQIKDLAQGTPVNQISFTRKGSSDK